MFFGYSLTLSAVPAIMQRSEGFAKGAPEAKGVLGLNKWPNIFNLFEGCQKGIDLQDDGLVLR